jgi:hypothetical protein
MNEGFRLSQDLLEDSRDRPVRFDGAIGDRLSGALQNCPLSR